MRKVTLSLAIIAIILSFVSCSSDNDAEAYNNRGAAKGELGDFKGAIADWVKAIDLDLSYEGKLQPFIDEARGKLK